MNMNKRDVASDVFTLSSVLSAEECAAFIQMTEAAGFEAATINVGGRAEVITDVRNNARVISDDTEQAAQLWTRIANHVPPFLNGRQARGLNERFRFYRYEPGQQFRWHQDGSFERANGEKSLLTFMVYLNDNFTGGETTFNNAVIAPETGTALVFRHELLHEGATVQNGVKYVLRSDIMYGALGKLYG